MSFICVLYAVCDPLFLVSAWGEYGTAQKTTAQVTLSFWHLQSHLSCECPLCQLGGVMAFYGPPLVTRPACCHTAAGCVCVSAECSVTGDSHVSTFDGRMFLHSGACQYVLAKSRGSGRFTLTLQYVPCGEVRPVISLINFCQQGKVEDEIKVNEGKCRMCGVDLRQSVCVVVQAESEGKGTAKMVRRGVFFPSCRGKWGKS